VKSPVTLYKGCTGERGTRRRGSEEVGNVPLRKF
jgi:hypothetical protein